MQFATSGVTVDLVVAEGDFVADRITAHRVRVDSGQATEWVENRIYRLNAGGIDELWPAGGLALG